MPDEGDWDTPQIFEYDNYEEKIFKINPISKEFVGKELWEWAHLSYGLMWHPVRGHFNPSSIKPYPSTSEAAGRPWFLAEGDEHDKAKMQLRDGITITVADAATRAVRAYGLLHRAAHARGSGRG
jgi:hypothetical protein